MKPVSSEKTSWLPDITSRTLHILAMFLMLLDHAWATIVPDQNWMTAVGRLAFPIFAFLIVEGYSHTHNLKKYMLRMLVFAVISEIPFNLMYGSSVIYPYHQNVLWTFLIALGGMWLMDKIKARFSPLWAAVLMTLVIAFCPLLAAVCMTDYYATGVWTVFVFYIFRQRNWVSLVGQIVVLYWLHVHVLGSMYYPVHIFGMEIHFVQQGLALLALIPIWLYHGRQGKHTKAFQYFCYAFYPVHISILVLLSFLF